MPTYTFECPFCGKREEVVCKIAERDALRPRCPDSHCAEQPQQTGEPPMPAAVMRRVEVEDSKHGLRPNGMFRMQIEFKNGVTRDFKTRNGE